VETTQQAKRSGTLRDRASADPPTLDPTAANAPLNAIVNRCYSSLVTFKPGYLKPSENELAPELAESWEISPDGLQITLKLRQGVKFHNKPPVNGRTLDAEDILFSWNRFSRLAQARFGVVNSVNPDAPVISMTATDPRTIVVKLTQPLVYALGLLSWDLNPTGSLTIFPKEADGTLNVKNDVIGTGAYVLSSYVPSVTTVFKRHPEHWDKDWALVEQVDSPIVSEYAAALSQFKAGNIHSFTPRPEELLSVKGDEPRISIYEGDPGGGLLASIKLNYGWAGKSPFMDERVRQAVSMSWDRDLYLEAFLNVSKFEAAGLPVETRWNTALPLTAEGWWLDPKGKDFGPNAKYYQHNMDEAKKLLAAAGYPNGVDVVSRYITTNELDIARYAQVLDGMAAEAGVRNKPYSLNYQQEYVPLRGAHGQFENGWAYLVANEPTGGDFSIILVNEYWSKGGNAFHGFSSNGTNDQSGDPQFDAMALKARVERDVEKRRELTFEMQRYLAKAAYSLSPPGGGTTFTMAWPSLGNYRVYRGAGRYAYYRLWVDETKPPYKAA
jgi:peptide/nickel transport system substrate-binding protein